MRDKRRNIFDEFHDIYIDVFLCGYEEEGESNVFILYTIKPKYKILYSLVIDCYDDGSINITKKILDKLSEKLGKKIKLDMVIWTHPHDDHTKGLKLIIENYCNKNTKIIAANIANSNIEFSETSQGLIKYLTTINYHLKNRWNISTTEKLGDLLQSIQFTGKVDLIKELEIKCIAPCPDIISQEITEDVLNHLCIGVVIEVKSDEGSLNFMFAADMEEKTIREVISEQEAEGIPSQYDYIKIPHHGGLSGELITGLLDSENKSDIAASTIFSKTMKDGVSYNPNEEVLKRFREYVNEVDVTTNIFEGKRGAGVIQIKYDLVKKDRDVFAYGQAVRNIC